MEHESCEKQTPIQFRCKKILPSMEKMDNPYPVTAETAEIDEKEGLGCILASPTPQKPESKRREKGVTYAMKEKQLESEVVDLENTSDGGSSVSEFSKLRPLELSRLLKDGQIELPDKYKTLSTLFDRMESSIRLLALRKKLPTFQNICTQVEILTRRKFLCSHLAQMKHVFPEAIHIEKILIHDKESLCMRPDMKITLVPNAVECPMEPDQSASMALSQAFDAKLLELCSTNPVGADVPEALLPEPFDQRNHGILANESPEGSPVGVPEQPSLDSVPLPLSSTSHFASSFFRQFSQKVIVPESQRTQLLASPTSLVSVGTADNEGEGFSKSPPRKENLCSVSSVKSSDEVICAPQTGMISQFVYTPVKYGSDADESMLETPSLQTPQRPIPTPDEKLKSISESEWTPSARRSLIYLSSENDGSVFDPVVCTTEQNKATEYSCQWTTTSKTNVLKEETGGSSKNELQVTGVKVISEFEDHMPNLAAQGMRRELLTCLPNMFDTICLISKSLDYSFITKQELVHKIISNNLEIEETSEVEEQLNLLEELVPDWICKKTVSTGDFLYCFKRTSDPESIRARLVEAV